MVGHFRSLLQSLTCGGVGIELYRSDTFARRARQQKGRAKKRPQRSAVGEL